jgi:NitT/TauT family transport system ATP-binding protein
MNRLQPMEVRIASAQKLQQPILEVRGVTRNFRSSGGDSVQALGLTNLQLMRGDFVAFVGESGCGKTTLLKMIGGLMFPSTGEIIYRGARVTGPLSDLGIVFQRAALLEWRTVKGNITLQLSVRNLGTKEEQRRLTSDLLARVGLSGFEERYPWELSGGQQQRVALCRALIHRPGLLLMDEPFGALDALTREQLQSDLERLWMADRPTVLFVTHDVGEAVSLADRVIVLGGKPGGIVADINIAVPRPRSGALLESLELQRYAQQIKALLSPQKGSFRANHLAPTKEIEP